LLLVLQQWLALLVLLMACLQLLPVQWKAQPEQMQPIRSVVLQLVAALPLAAAAAAAASPAAVPSGAAADPAAAAASAAAVPPAAAVLLPPVAAPLPASAAATLPSVAAPAPAAAAPSAGAWLPWKRPSPSQPALAAPPQPTAQQPLPPLLPQPLPLLHPLLQLLKSLPGCCLIGCYSSCSCQLVAAAGEVPAAADDVPAAAGCQVLHHGSRAASMSGLVR